MIVKFYGLIEIEFVSYSIMFSKVHEALGYTSLFHLFFFPIFRTIVSTDTLKTEVQSFRLSAGNGSSVIIVPRLRHIFLYYYMLLKQCCSLVKVKMPFKLGFCRYKAFVYSNLIFNLPKPLCYL